ncbi:MAG: GerMN domain-containing protein [Anaerolineales bacterium]
MKPLPVVLLVALAALSLSGCGTTETEVGVPATALAASAAVPSTLGLPTAASGESPSAAAAPLVGTATAPPAPTTPRQIMLHVFLIAIGDNGMSGKKIGCGDSVVPVPMEVPYTVGVLKASLNALFSLKERDYGERGLYNSLYQSDLRVQDALLEDGTATVNLTGNLQLGGECDNPRVKAQIEETALQFSTLHQLKVFLNGEPLDQALSLK